MKIKDPQVYGGISAQKVNSYEATDRFVAVGFNRFYLDYPPVTESESVFINGIMQMPYEDYSIDSTSEHPCVIFVSAPVSDDRVVVKYRRTQDRIHADRVGTYGASYASSYQTMFIDSTGNVQYTGYGISNSFIYFPNLRQERVSYTALAQGFGLQTLMIEDTGNVRAYGNPSFYPGGPGPLPQIARPGSYNAVRHYNSYGGGVIEASTGMIYNWGFQQNLGNVGNNSFTNVNSPVALARPGSYKDLGWSAWVNGSDHYSAGAAIDYQGKIWTWGSNYQGQLGNGSGSSTPESSPVSIIRQDGLYRQLGGGNGTKMALDTAGRLWAWGYNSQGEFGNGTITSTTSPVAAGVCTAQFTEFSMGLFSHVLALDSSGHIWAWGNNSYGQLGLGDTTNRSIPVSIPSAVSYKHVYTGELWSLAQDHTNVLWAWGRNAHGQLGLGDTIDRSSPISVKQM